MGFSAKLWLNYTNFTEILLSSDEKKSIQVPTILRHWHFEEIVRFPKVFWNNNINNIENWLNRTFKGFGLSKFP